MPRNSPILFVQLPIALEKSSFPEERSTARKRVNLSFAEWAQMCIRDSNHVLDASCDAVIAVLVLYSKVSRVQEAVLINDFGCGLDVYKRQD